MTISENKLPVRVFRHDINGLRAWAVMAVVLYHFGVSGFVGGFVGVDIFFVISGFLMTSIIIGSLASGGRFSLFAFYVSRARRILPALIVLCAVLMLTGWFLLPREEYQILAKHTMSALTFHSNSTFWQESGYFDTSAYDKWLLHTWSLSVEWQFYLLLPLILMVTWRLSHRQNALIAVMALLAVGSLSASILISPTHPSAAFYLLPMRAWEMLTGGLVFLLGRRVLPSPLIRSCFVATGFALIVFSLLTIKPGNGWPGWQALAPVLGSALVIFAARQDNILTRAKIMQWLGDRSYSIYLWHWPVVAALALLELRQNPGATIAGLALSLLLGYISYELVERKSQHLFSRQTHVIALMSIVGAMLLVMIPSMLVERNSGLPTRTVAVKAETIEREAAVRNPRLTECFVNASKNKVTDAQCTYGGPELGVIVLGDSHAASIVRAVERSLPDARLHVLDWELHSCPSIFGIKLNTDPNDTCSEFLGLALEKQKTLPSNVPLLIVNRTSTYIFGPNEPDRVAEVDTPPFYITRPYGSVTPQFLAEMRNGIIQTACEFAKTRPVYMVRPFPELKINVPKTMARRAMLPIGAQRVSISVEEYTQRNAFVWEAQDAAAKQCGVKILDPLPYLCDAQRCYGDQDGIPLYVDDDHLNEHGGDRLIPMFSKIFQISSDH
ncbi:acyltransferase family protein [Pseudomonas putida]|uniref:acyltransferase family protein n=1 Tax=Pseudomonas putida TaxID=303 RepID=UPI00383A182A